MHPHLMCIASAQSFTSPVLSCPVPREAVLPKCYCCILWESPQPQESPWGKPRSSYWHSSSLEQPCVVHPSLTRGFRMQRRVPPPIPTPPGATLSLPHPVLSSSTPCPQKIPAGQRSHHNWWNDSRSAELRLCATGAGPMPVLWPSVLDSITVQ